MILLPDAILVIQDRESLTREGLPYWILWFSLCVIFLLLVFIFLRDKDLRRRLDFFFLSAKHKSILIRLRMKLNKEKQNLEALWKDLGEKAWELDLNFPEAESVRRDLEPLEKKRLKLHMEWDKIFKDIERLGQPAGPASASQETERRLRELERRRSHIQEKIKRIEKIRDDRFRSFGKLLDSIRPERLELTAIYSRINEANQLIFHIEKRMENLSL